MADKTTEDQTKKTTTGLDVEQLRDYVIIPVLDRLNLNTPAAVQLLLGTAAQESRFRYLHQLGSGPAVGLYQMEPNTHDDIWANFLRARNSRAEAVKSLGKYHTPGEMLYNLNYATAMCRIHYYRRPEGLPAYNDVEAMAHYWKNHHNTHKGAGTVEEFIEAFHDFDLVSI